MPQYEHLQLVRLPERLARRKTGRPPVAPVPNEGHSPRIRSEIERAVQDQRAQARPARFVDPSLILRVQMHGLAMEEDWEGLGLTLLATDEENTLVLFSSSDDLHDFRRRLDAYDGPVPEGQKDQRYAGFINRIGDIGTIAPQNRIGVRAKEMGFVEVDDFQLNEEYVVDIELWEFGSQAARRVVADDIIAWVEEQGGELYDHYTGPSITIIRVRAMGQTIRPTLAIPQIAFIDFPPQPDLTADDHLELAIADAPPVAPLDDNLPIISILDSGINDHPFFVGAVVAREAFPPELGEADMWGHGTQVAGIATMGDLRSQLGAAQIRRSARLISAKVVTDEGQFHERRTLPTQMRQAIERLNADHGCRIFVIALGDTRARYERGRVGPWAATLDELARELNVLIFVSAGNRSPRGGPAIEQGITQYPQYLLEDANRVCEPAGAVNVVTVGSIAQSNGLGAGQDFDVHVRPITSASEPSPFSRAGPGGGGIKKPDFVDYGGTLVFDAVAGRLQSAPLYPSAGVLTTNADFLRQLFVSKSGTSFSAPALAHKAAQILRQHPQASANLVKALMAGAARIPEEAELRLRAMAAVESEQISGNGLVNTHSASHSDDHRVVLFAEDSLEIDQFAVYVVSIPVEFQGNGRRSLRVSLAFDPPVKRTRAEYVGTRMNFRLIRGCNSDKVFEHFRSRAAEDGPAPDMENRYNVALQPGPKRRDRNTIQTSSVSFTNDTNQYGDEYYLVVRCVGGWAASEQVRQNYSVVVELEHEKPVHLYARMRPRVRAQI